MSSPPSGRPTGTHLGIDWDAQPLGVEPDQTIAARLGLNVSSARCARLRRGIAPPKRGALDRLGTAAMRLLGTGLTDREVAEQLGITSHQARWARQRARTPNTLRHIAWDAVPLGTEPDIDFAARLGVSVSAVCDARRRRGIPRFCESRVCACGTPFRAYTRDQVWCSPPCQEAAGAARHSGRTDELVDLYVVRAALARDLRRIS